MLKKSITVIAILMIVAVGFFGFVQLTDDPTKDVVGPNDQSNTINTNITPTGKTAPTSVDGILYDMGQLVSHPGQGFGGADASAIQGTGTLFGSGNNMALGYQMSDAFTIPAGVQWKIDSIKFFSYQTGSTLTSTLTASRLRIFLGVGPDTTGAVVVAGDSTTNRMKTTYFTNIYRVTSTTLTGNTRPIMAVTDTLNVTLNPGNYWVSTGFFGTLASGPWAPPRTDAGPNLLTGTARQKVPGAGWALALDGTTQVGLPFVIYGSVILPPPTTPVWTPQVSGVTSSLNCVSTVNANVGWIGGDAGVILLTTNAGTTWVSKANATVGANGVYAICGISATTCLVSTSPANTFVFKTTDGGTTWAQVFTQVGGFVDDIRMKDATTGFMYGDPVGTRWSLWKTTNAGTTWDSAGLYLPQAAAEAGWNNAMFIDGNAIWFGTNNTKVYKSINFGATGSWVSGATTGSANSYSVAFNNAKGFSGTSAAVVSTDAGLTYTATTFLGAGNIYAINAVKNTNKFWFERANIVYASTDNGTTWAAQYTGTAGVTYQAMSIVLSGSTLRGWTLSNTGEIIMFDQQNVVTGVNPVYTATTPNNYNLSQNYPNPFNPTTRINFALPKSGLVTLKVYNILGKEVATLVNEVKNIGTYSVDFNASNLSSGIYFYKLEVNGFSEVKKMSLIK